MEHWKDINGTEGRYQISDAGRARSKPMVLNCGFGRTHERNGTILKPTLNSKGYYRVSINRKHMLVHRLVAIHFVDNPNNFPIVNHKDENKTNNNAENLEWCTHYYNTHYGKCIEKVSAKAALRSHKVIQTFPNGTKKEWKSLREIGRCGYNRETIRRCCKHNGGRAYGCVWNYAEGGEK